LKDIEAFLYFDSLRIEVIKSNEYFHFK